MFFWAVYACYSHIPKPVKGSDINAYRTLTYSRYPQIFFILLKIFLNKVDKKLIRYKIFFQRAFCRSKYGTISDSSLFF